MQTSRYTNLHNLQIIWASWKELTFEYFYKKNCEWTISVSDEAHLWVF